jgi:hypothetical protein
LTAIGLRAAPNGSLRLKPTETCQSAIGPFGDIALAKIRTSGLAKSRHPVASPLIEPPVLVRSDVPVAGADWQQCPKIGRPLSTQSLSFELIALSVWLSQKRPMRSRGTSC